ALPDNAKELVVERSDKPGVNTSIYEVEFTKENTPFEFSSHIVYGTDNKFSETHTFTSNFWVNKVTEMNGDHFLGPRVGRNQEGYSIFKLPFRKSTAFYCEISKTKSLLYKNKKK
ncbi:MAG: hypothetical protein SNJ71_04065, partial [Bacteroidales bacterium]